jgi:carbon-monoxide dehydrogenase medium subunit
MLPRFRYLRAGSVEETLDFLSDHTTDSRVLAGGTDLLISLRDGVCKARYVIDIKGIPDLCGMKVDKTGQVSIGACATVNTLLEFEDFPDGMAAVREAASVLATYQLRNRATVGGNICNASPACDLGPPLLVLGASVKAVSSEGERTIPIQDLFTCVKETCLAQTEIVTEVVIPPSDGTVSCFMKRTRVRGHDLATVNAAGALSKTHGLKLALGAVAPTPVLVDEFDGVGLDEHDKITEVALAAISPVDDVRGTALYRRRMARFLIGEILDTLTPKSGRAA